ncbi:MAG: flagellar assembly protein FliH [Comamonas sp.]|nr:flagellar assembly protein FliH [Candidatus Comamonas equi]
MTRFIPSEEIDSQRVQHWHFGSVKGSAAGFTVMPEMMLNPAVQAEPEVAQPELVQEPLQEEATDVAELVAEPAPEPGIPEEQVQQLLEQARQEAFQQGVVHGENQASQTWQARLQDYQNNAGRETAQQLNEVLLGAQNAVQGLQQKMAPDLLQLACDIARQVVRQELRCNPQALQPVVREALEMLGADTKPAIVRLHPKDFEHLLPHLREALPNPKVEWLADASVPAGGCLVESQGAQVDGSLERRWQRAVAALGLVSTWYEGAPNGQ